MSWAAAAAVGGRPEWVPGCPPVCRVRSAGRRVPPRPGAARAGWGV